MNIDIHYLSLWHLQAFKRELQLCCRELTQVKSSHWTTCYSTCFTAWSRLSQNCVSWAITMEELWKLKVQDVKCHPASHGQILVAILCEGAARASMKRHYYISPRSASQFYYFRMTRDSDQRNIMSFTSLPAVALFAAQHLFSGQSWALA